MNNEQILKIAHEGMKVAREYFVISPVWDIELATEKLTGNAAMRSWVTEGYWKAYIAIDTDAHKTPAQVWRNIGHEIAHIAAHPIMTFEKVLRAGGKLSGETEELYVTCLEQTIAVMERMWVRDRPYHDVGVDGLE